MKLVIFATVMLCVASAARCDIVDQFAAALEAAQTTKHAPLDKKTQELFEALGLWPGPLEDRVKRVKKIVEEGANVRGRDKNGDSPLHMAAQWAFGSLDTLKYLMKTDAQHDIHAQNYLGFTPLHSAIAFGGGEEIAKFLVQQGANINQPNNIGETPFHFAVSRSKDLVDFFVSKGANVRAPDPLKETPLHKAAFSGSLEAVQHLMSTDAQHDINALDIFNHTPVDVARERHDQQGKGKGVFEYLKQQQELKNK